MKGLDEVQLNGTVVFNFLVGDTIMSGPAYRGNDHYHDVYTLGINFLAQQNPNINLSAVNTLQRRVFFDKAYATGRAYIMRNIGTCGALDWCPTGRRESYVKCCVGFPGQILQIKDKIAYVDGKTSKEPEKVEYIYFIKFKNIIVSDFTGERYDGLRKDLKINDKDIQALSLLKEYDSNQGKVLNKNIPSYDGYILLTKRAVVELKCQGLVQFICPVIDRDFRSGSYYPLNDFIGWIRDNYGPIWIPAEGRSIKLALENLPVYKRCIKVHEGNDLRVKDGKIYINGKLFDSYTFKVDYYWVTGDNRHNSADSRF